MENEFTKNTREFLKPNSKTNKRKYYKYREAINGFSISKNVINEKEYGVLILGLNPSGDKKTADWEKEKEYINLYYIPELKINEHPLNKKCIDFHYPKYFSLIWNLMADVHGEENIKWDWCNENWKSIEKRISSFSSNETKKIKEFYEKHKNAKFTIYIGDVLYYHDKNSKNIINMINNTNNDFGNYCRISLENHIQKINKTGRKVKYVYINNSYVSKQFDSDMTHIPFPSTQKGVFLGPMMSNGVMDVFSRKRLENEIKSSLM